MKAVTANRLEDGAVVYLAADDSWTINIAAAIRLGDDEAGAALAAAEKRVTEIAGAYLINLDDAGAPAGREKLRESIRKSGPTVRPDLGRQSSVNAEKAV